MKNSEPKFYLERSDAKKLATLVERHPFFAVPAHETIDWMEAVELRQKRNEGDHAFVDRYDGRQILASLLWVNPDDGECLQALHDLGDRLVFDDVFVGGTAHPSDVRIPGYVDIAAIPDFIRDQKDLVRKTADANFLAGRKAGQEAMRQAFRGLIGAAPLVELEESF